MPSDVALGQPANLFAAYAHLAVVTGTTRPVPLVATHFSIRIDCGLATVTTARTFRNAEAESIEATMTFPVPVHATLFDLQARIAGRVLSGKARRRDAARDGYEGAIDRGKSAVLHEEVLRGVHMISVGHVPPGEQITVTGTWAMPLSLAADGTATLHIPVTVGDVYGRPPIPDSDAPAQGGPMQDAEVEIVAADGVLRLDGTAPVDGHAQVRLDRPIRLSVTGWRAGTLQGVAADGRAVSLEIAPASAGLLPLDVAVLVDRSSSMAEAAEGHRTPIHEGIPSRPTKHDVVIAALRKMAPLLDDRDRLDLWQFDDAVEHVSGSSFAECVRRLSPPRGGTEIGLAIRLALADRPSRDVLLITDGKSHALDVQEAARSGRRFHVLLIGEDSLEANVGHLAALTGGSLFVTAGDEGGAVLPMAIAAMRTPHVPHPSIEGFPASAEACLGGLLLCARWCDVKPDRVSEASPSVAAIAAAMALPYMLQADAAALAEAEGIVCHLTSLLLVDEDGATQEGIPAQQKIATMSPSLSRFARHSESSSVAHELPAFLRRRNKETTESEALVEAAGSKPKASLFGGDRDGTRFGSRLARWAASLRHLGHLDAQASEQAAGAAGLIGAINWATNPEALRRGELSGLPGWAIRRVSAASTLPEVRALADVLAVPAEVVVLALLARAEKRTSRSAARFARAVLAQADATLVQAAARAVGL